MCPPWCKIQNYYLYVQGMSATPAPSLVLIKWRGQKILSGKHHRLRRVVWPWNMWPWKSIKIMYLLRATPSPSLILIKWRGQKIFSGQHRPTFAKQYALFFKGGIKIKCLFNRCIIHNNFTALYLFKASSISILRSQSTIRTDQVSYRKLPLHRGHCRRKQNTPQDREDESCCCSRWRISRGKDRWCWQD